MKKLFIMTGEASADIHAAKVVEYLKSFSSDIQIEAIGGDNLKKLGVKLFSDHSKMSAAGLNLKILIDHINLGKNLLDYLKNEYKPDLILMIDYGGFNLNMSKLLKKNGFKNFYFIPPQIWASRPWRINTVKKNIDKVFYIFPFEQKLYEKNNINCEFVGHPLTTELPQKANREEFFKKYDLDLSKKLISIFPGSRIFELKHLVNTFLKSKELIEKELSDVQFVISEAPNFKEGTLKKYLKNSDIKIIRADNRALLSVSDSLILSSGTVALEAGLYQTPMVISYKAPWLFYFIYLLVRAIKRVCLPNIILDEDIIQELIQHKSTPKLISQEIIKIHKNEEYRNFMINKLNTMANNFSDKNAPMIVAQRIVEELS